MLDARKLDIMAIQETKVCDKTPDEDLRINHHTIYRKDRSNNGGGVALIVGSQLPASRAGVDIPALEAVAVRLLLSPSEQVIVATFYRPPGLTKDQSSDWIEHFGAFLSSLELRPNSALVITGDFNLDFRLDESAELREVLQSFDLVTANQDTVTHGSRLIDWVATTGLRNVNLTMDAPIEKATRRSQCQPSRMGSIRSTPISQRPKLSPRPLKATTFYHRRG